MRNRYKILVRGAEEKEPLGDLGTDGKMIFKMGLKRNRI
jgi:hypothetical protein